MFNFSIKIESLENFKNSQNFHFFLSKEELKVKNPVSLLGKVALKKAFFDCLKLNNEFKKIEIKKLKSGRPAIKIKDPKLKKKLRNKKITFSLSHTKDLAVAICLIYE
ncbi:MAG: hypothetical protein NC926_08515 [Candidatus Omnitrophica bacterium]|nr:hypothetical protein [Candidatus Omnitrophota bacterium]MCM8807963.1 hypothetical protein [Candidatus Omnitrophota bacterium]